MRQARRSELTAISRIPAEHFLWTFFALSHASQAYSQATLPCDWGEVAPYEELQTLLRAEKVGKKKLSLLIELIFF